MKLNKFFTLIFLLTAILFHTGFVFSQSNPEELFITVSYSGLRDEEQTITVKYDDNWLLGDQNKYNHDLMRASFALAAAGFRCREHDLSNKDIDILDFFSQAGFTNPRTDDYDVTPTVETIGSAIASKTAGDTTLIVLSISGNNYGMEWLSNLTVDDENRAKGFNDAAEKVWTRLKDYIRENTLEGNLHLWLAGYSRAAAVANIVAADASDSGIFESVYAYTFATPRPTTELNAGKYNNIYNIIIPFDPVPMIPFPEWGFWRYGVDLFLPSIQTDSDFQEKRELADTVSETITGSPLVFNPRNSLQLHTILDYLAFFINSASSYKETYQNGMLSLWGNKDIQPLASNIWQRIRLNQSISVYQMHELYNFTDYIMQVIYTNFMASRYGKGNIYWDAGLTIQENIAHNHYDSTYRSWLFSDISVEDLFTDAPLYAHYVVNGDVDVEIFDEAGDFVLKVYADGNIMTNPADVKTPGFNGGVSKTVLYAERQGKRTLIVLPMDQNFSASVRSLTDQNVRFSYVEYSTDDLHAIVNYIYDDNYSRDEIYTEVLDPMLEGDYTKEDLQHMGVLVVEPWSENIVYSPTAVMRLENKDVFHPTPRFVMILLALAVMIAGFIVFILIKLTRRFSKRMAVRVIQMKKAPREEN